MKEVTQESGDSDNTLKTFSEGAHDFCLRIKAWFSSLSTKMKILVVSGGVAFLLFLIPDKGASVKSDEGDGDALSEQIERIQQANMNQSIICVLKISAKTCIYYVDKMTQLDMTPYEVAYTHLGEVDVVVDLSDANVEVRNNKIVIRIPEPYIDSDTLNIRPLSTKREYASNGNFRTERRRTMIEERVRNLIRDDLKKTVDENFLEGRQMGTARKQALVILSSLYTSLGCENVQIEFTNRMSDFRSNY